MALSMTEKDALAFLQSWTPSSDVYAFRHGHTVLTCSTTASAIFINMKFRRAFKLRNFAFISTYGAAVMIPAVASALLHGMLVVRPMLTKQVRCPVCLETRGAMTQVMCGVLYPSLLSPLACLPFADRYMTMAVPLITKQPMLVVKQVVKVLRPLSKKLLIIAAVQAFIGGALVHCELSNIFTVVEKVEGMERVVSKTLSEEKMKQLKHDAAHEDLQDMVKPEKLKKKYLFSVE